MPVNMVTRRIGALLILRESAGTPSDEEWDECLRLIPTDPEQLAQLRVLVVTDGGGPTPDQRRRLQRALAGVPVRVAVVSESVRVRFIVSSVALLTSKIQSFSLREFNSALSHLDLPPDDVRAAQQAIREMTAALSR